MAYIALFNTLIRPCKIQNTVVTSANVLDLNKPSKVPNVTFEMFIPHYIMEYVVQSLSLTYVREQPKG